MRKSTIATIALMTTIVALAPPASAEPEDSVLCPTPDPGTWVNYCVKVTAATYTVYIVNSKELVYTQVCPVTGTCVPVPTLPSVIDAIHPYDITAYTVSASGTNVNGEALLYDICVIVFGGPEYCRTSAMAVTDLNGDGIIDGVIANNVFLPLGPA